MFGVTKKNLTKNKIYISFSLFENGLNYGLVSIKIKNKL